MAAPTEPEWTKEALRMAMRRVRKGLPAAEREAAHRAMEAALWPLCREVHGVIALFAPSAHEASSVGVARALEHLGRVCAWPRVLTEPRGLTFELSPFDALRPGHGGLREPPPGATPVALEHIGLMVVPGLAFDREGRRLGQGGGYYDRVLDAVTGLKVGLCYSGQLVASVPTDPHDARVDAVLTEAGLVTCARP